MPLIPDRSPSDGESAGSSTASEKFFSDGSERTGPERQYTFFLVEDDQGDRDATLAVLKKSPYVHNVHCFASGDRLLRHFLEAGYYGAGAHNSIPAMILLDISLPGTDGLGILKRLKNNPFTAQIPVVMMTGNDSDKNVEAAFSSQADAYIGKPVDLVRIHEVLLKGWSWPGR